MNIKHLDPDKIIIHEKSYKNICHIGNVTVKGLSYVIINTVNPLYFMINIINECIEETNRNKNLKPVSTDESKNILRKNEEM